MQRDQIACSSFPTETRGPESLVFSAAQRLWTGFWLAARLSSASICLLRQYRSAFRITFSANGAPANIRPKFWAAGSIGFALCAALASSIVPQTALAACSPGGPSIASGTTVTCSAGSTQTGRIGNGPNGAPGAGNNVTVNVNNGATISVTNTNAISLGNNAIITLGSGSGAAVTVQTTTTSAFNGGEYGFGDNTIEFNNNNTLTVNANASVIASGPETTEEAINPIGAGNAIINRGLIKAGASSAIFFENVNTTGASLRNSVDNFGTIDARGGTNPTTGGEAIGSFNNVGIDITNETGAFIYGNLDLQGGSDVVTLRTGSTITGNLNGGGGTNLLNLNAVAGASDSLPGVVQNFQTLNKSGAGTWTLTGSVGQSSGAPLVMNVLGGTLVLTGDNAGFNGTVIIDPGATLEARAQSLPPTIDDLNGDLLINQVSPDGIQPNDGTYAGHIIGSGIVTKIGVGTLTLTGTASTYSGGTIFDEGADRRKRGFGARRRYRGADIQRGRTAAGQQLQSRRHAGDHAEQRGRRFRRRRNDRRERLPDDNRTGRHGRGRAHRHRRQRNRRRSVILTGANTYAGGTTIEAGTLQLGDGGTTGSIGTDVIDNGTLAFDRSDDVTFEGNISGTGSVNQIGPGSLTLTSDNTYSGGTLLAAGTIIAGTSGALGSGALTVAANPGGTTLDNTADATVLANAIVLNPSANLTVAGSNPLTLAGTISGAGALTKNGASPLILTADNTYSGGTTIASGVLQLGAGGATGGIVGDVVDNGELVFDRSNEMVFPGAISGAGAVSQIGSGGTILTADSSYTGGTTIASGFLQLGLGGTTGSIVGDVADNGTLVFNRSDTMTFAGVISGSGAVAQAGSGTTILTGASTYLGGTTIAAGTLQLGDGGTTGGIIGDVLNFGALAFDRSDAVTFDGTISGTGSVHQIGSGSTTLTAANTYSGVTILSDGALIAGNNSALGTGALIVAPDLFGTTTLDNTAAATSLANPIRIDLLSNLIVGGSNPLTLSGEISGGGRLTKDGPSTLILTAADNFTGGTTINSGTLQLGDGGTTGGIVGDVADGGTLAFDRSDTVTFAGLISGAGAVAQIGSGTTILTADNTYTGGTTIAAGTLQLGNGGTTGAILGNVLDNGALAFDRSNTLAFPGVISGSGSVSQIGSGTTILTADSPYTGGTTVSRGALAVGDFAHPSAALSGGGPITVEAGGALGGYGTVTGPTVNNGVIAAANATPGFAGSPTGTFTIHGDLLNQGVIQLASEASIGNVLEVGGDYVGAGAAMNINTYLGADGSPSDRLVISGGAATGNTSVHVTNVGGPGALTTANGILVVDAVGGATTSPGAFSLANPELRAGAFDYRLFRGGVSVAAPTTGSCAPIST